LQRRQGRHTHKGSYSFSHDWLQRYDSRRRDDRDDHRGALESMPSTLHQSDILFKGERFIICMESSPKNSANRGSISRESSVRWRNHKEIYPFLLMSKGER
jgi:hypothetical protein